MRGFLGIVSGLVSAVLAAMLISFIGGLILPTSVTAIDLSSANSVRQAYASLTPEAQLLGVLAWAGGGFVGALVAKYIVGRPWAAWTIAGLTEAYMLLNVMMLPMPGWLQVVSLILPLIAGLLANHLVPNRAFVERDRPEEAATNAEA